MAGMQQPARDGLADGEALRIEAVDPDGPEARGCLARYHEELAVLFPEGFDPAQSTVSAAADFAPPRGTFLVARIGRQAVGCGGLTLVADDVGYIKKMWVDGSRRGLGLGRRMLDALEVEAAELGCRRVQLETNRALTAAIRLYRTSGYREVAPFNDERYAHHWFEKRIGDGEPGGRAPDA